MVSAEIAEAMIRDVLRANPKLTVDDLVLQVWPDGSLVVITRSLESKWLDWQSDNHGWGHD